jgi:MSHA biogenesis protein MshM
VALYLEQFGLSEPPFRITPHTDFFFEGADRGATLGALLYAVVHDEGIVKVTGEVGSGKTMLCRVLMERLPAATESVYLACPSLERHEILHAIAEDLELAVAGERTGVVLRKLQERLVGLYAAGRRVVALVDEAHTMPEETLEQVRLLSNLESSRHKLLQIVLFGQPELDATLAKPSLRQLRDRITHSFRTRPLTPAEVANYLSFRLRAAGYRGPQLFEPGALKRIASASGGLTRRINILADKALLGAFTANAQAVSARHVRMAVADSEFNRPSRAVRPRLAPGLAAAAAVLGAGIALGAALQSLLAPSPGTGALAPALQPLVQTPPQAPAETPPQAPAETPPQAPAAEEKSPARLSADQIRRIGAYQTAGQALLEERISAARELLEHAPDERYGIELFVTDNTEPARMERFLIRARALRALEQLYVIPMAAGGRQRLRVVYGAFETREQALAAERALPPRYKEAFRPAPRSFGELRRSL